MEWEWVPQLLLLEWLVISALKRYIMTTYYHLIMQLKSDFKSSEESPTLSTAPCGDQQSLLAWKAICMPRYCADLPSAVIPVTSNVRDSCVADIQDWIHSQKARMKPDQNHLPFSLHNLTEHEIQLNGQVLHLHYGKEDLNTDLSDLCNRDYAGKTSWKHAMFLWNLSE